MLEWIPTPYGEIIPKVNGSLLASRVDPWKEARAWLSVYRTEIDSSDSHFILGVGAGYHVMSAAQSFPNKKFLCIECHSELTRSKIFAEIRTLPNVDLVVTNEIDEVFKNRSIQESLSGLYTVLLHLPSLQVAPTFYDRIRQLLIGRDWRSFNHLLSFRSDEEKFLNQLNFTSEKNETISIIDIRRLITENGEELNYSQRIWLALGELIK